MSPSLSPSLLSWLPLGSYSSSGEWGFGQWRLSPCQYLQVGGQEDGGLGSHLSQECGPGAASPCELWHMDGLDSNPEHSRVPRTSLSQKAGAYLRGHSLPHPLSLSKAGTEIRSAGVTRGSRVVGGSRRASSTSQTSPPPLSASWDPTVTPWPPHPRQRSPGRARRVWINWAAMGRARHSSSTGEWPVSWDGWQAVGAVGQAGQRCHWGQWGSINGCC